MAVPKQRQNKARKGRRRAGQNKKLKAEGLQKCPDCSAMIRPHRVCPKCGKYKGRKIIETK